MPDPDQIMTTSPTTLSLLAVKYARTYGHELGDPYDEYGLSRVRIELHPLFGSGYWFTESWRRHRWYWREPTGQELKARTEPDADCLVSVTTDGGQLQIGEWATIEEFVEDCR